ncbi:MAG TPA: ATP-binding SpoIIE family protein phosphatase [Candidatus Binatia bacterium]|nr:ATP-binding SpoIIE family protein phosphatase [Candidatus Binatia bacterium]
MIPVWERQKTFEISEPSHVAEARRFTRELAEDARFNEYQTGGVALVTTELATNLLKHASSGEIVVRPIVERGIAGVELLALDKGSGIANVAESLRDGYSTAGTAGTGLGAIARLAAEFDIQTQPGKGTAVMARLWGGKLGEASQDHISIGAICKPMPGETRCGDGWGCELLADRCILVLVDGLGHGTGAAAAAELAVASVRQHRAKAPAAIVQYAHDALRATRGAALAVAEVDLAQQSLRFCGIGNISATIISGDSLRHLVSYNGTAGHEARKIVEFTYPWSADALLIMHSDGLMTRWNLQAYPGLLQRHPSLIAGVLYRDFVRGRDDVTVLTAKCRGVSTEQ